MHWKYDLPIKKDMNHKTKKENKFKINTTVQKCICQVGNKRGETNTFDI